ncbi:hypothetical protein EVAR_56714_1 [Eumeta japonica]|uniref:Uncharacterized protein n=1 Tax=Eumeta variegata TaxID=151549 RepID=A0A4C1Y0X4_EUMVA|nr:hypothetical protein EVAR_56714_1 [Eumeta japonica]
MEADKRRDHRSFVRPSIDRLNNSGLSGDPWRSPTSAFDISSLPEVDNTIVLPLRSRVSMGGSHHLLSDETPARLPLYYAIKKNCNLKRAGMWTGGRAMDYLGTTRGDRLDWCESTGVALASTPIN